MDSDVEVAKLPPAAQKVLSSEAPGPVKLMAARGVIPGARPGDIVIVVSVLASPGSKVFVRGSAFGQATLKVCHPSCRSVTDSRSIRLR